MKTSFSIVSWGSSAGVVTVFALDNVDTERSDAGVERFDDADDQSGRIGFVALMGRRREPFAWGGAPAVTILVFPTVATVDTVDAAMLCSAPSTSMLGTGASSGEIVTVSSNMVVGVSGRILELPFSSTTGAKPVRLAW